MEKEFDLDVHMLNTQGSDEKDVRITTISFCNQTLNTCNIFCK